MPPRRNRRKKPAEEGAPAEGAQSEGVPVEIIPVPPPYVKPVKDTSEKLVPINGPPILHMLVPGDINAVVPMTVPKGNTAIEADIAIIAAIGAYTEGCVIEISPVVIEACLKYAEKVIDGSRTMPSVVVQKTISGDDERGPYVSPAMMHAIMERVFELSSPGEEEYLKTNTVAAQVLCFVHAILSLYPTLGDTPEEKTCLLLVLLHFGFMTRPTESGRELIIVYTKMCSLSALYKDAVYNCDAEVAMKGQHCVIRAVALKRLKKGDKIILEPFMFSARSWIAAEIGPTKFPDLMPEEEETQTDYVTYGLGYPAYPDATAKSVPAGKVVCTIPLPQVVSAEFVGKTMRCLRTKFTDQSTELRAMFPIERDWYDFLYRIACSRGITLFGRRITTVNEFWSFIENDAMEFIQQLAEDIPLDLHEFILCRTRYYCEVLGRKRDVQSVMQMYVLLFCVGPLITPNDDITVFFMYPEFLHGQENVAHDVMEDQYGGLSINIVSETDIAKGTPLVASRVIVTLASLYAKHKTRADRDAENKRKAEVEKKRLQDKLQRDEYERQMAILAANSLAAKLLKEEEAEAARKKREVKAAKREKRAAFQASFESAEASEAARLAQKEHADRMKREAKAAHEKTEQEREAREKAEREIDRREEAQKAARVRRSIEVYSDNASHKFERLSLKQLTRMSTETRARLAKAKVSVAVINAAMRVRCHNMVMLAFDGSDNVDTFNRMMQQVTDAFAQNDTAGTEKFSAEDLSQFVALDMQTLISLHVPLVKFLDSVRCHLADINHAIEIKFYCVSKRIAGSIVWPESTDAIPEQASPAELEDTKRNRDILMDAHLSVKCMASDALEISATTPWRSDKSLLKRRALVKENLQVMQLATKIAKEHLDNIMNSTDIDGDVLDEAFDLASDLELVADFHHQLLKSILTMMIARR